MKQTEMIQWRENGKKRAIRVEPVISHEYNKGDRINKYVESLDKFGDRKEVVETWGNTRFYQSLSGKVCNKW